MKNMLDRNITFPDKKQLNGFSIGLILTFPRNYFSFNFYIPSNFAGKFLQLTPRRTECESIYFTTESIDYVFHILHYFSANNECSILLDTIFY